MRQIIKKHRNKGSYKNLFMVLLMSCSLTACGSLDRLANVGKPPSMSAIENPQLKTDYKPVSMPMPAPSVQEKQPNSLWASNRKNFFKDQRAGDVGDILTVLIEIKDNAKLNNDSERTRASDEKSGLNNFLGYEASLNRILPQAVDNKNLTGFDTTSTYNGTGTIDRKEKIKVKLAALITQILPNGNLVIDGRQEIRINFEKRIVRIAGVIRPEDISTKNTINYDQIAEARISYGGKGQITDVQQPRYGQQVYDILFPF